MNKLELVKALLSDEGTETTADLSGGSKIKIVILQRGWVFVGKYSQEGMKCTLTNAYNIRTWGTTKGLGELAEDGPQSATKLDKVNDVQFHILTAIAAIDCNDKSWAKTI